MSKVLIIGGGTGSTTADMLEHMSNMSVTLTEASDRLGGHINSLYFELIGDDPYHPESYKILSFEDAQEAFKDSKRKVVVAEGGAEFIGPPEAYPNVHTHFGKLGVKLDEYAMSTHLHPYKENTVSNNDVVLPPIYHATEERVAKNPQLFKQVNRRQKNMRVDLKSLFTDFPHLIELQLALSKLAHDINSGNPSAVKTLEQFIEDFKHNSIIPNSEIDQFANEVLYPIVAASWGVPILKAKEYMAHYAMNYLSLGMDWYDAPQGLSSYIHAMQERWKNCDTRTNTTVTRVELAQSSTIEAPKYIARLSDDSILADKEGNPIEYDEIVVATPANVTKDILSGLRHLPEMGALIEKLSAVRYYDTTVAFHLDKRYETDRQTVVHTRMEGDLAVNTAQKDWKGPVMKTWVLPGQEMPNHVLSTKQYKHPHMDKAYYEAQEALRAYQNKYGIHFGGILAGLGDSHEDALTVALETAHRICEKEKCVAQNDRLKPFLTPDLKQIARKDNEQLSAKLEARKGNHAPVNTGCCAGGCVVA